MPKRKQPIWNPTTRQYSTDGEPITADQLRDWVNQTVERAGDDFAKLARQYARGKISEADLAIGMDDRLKALHRSMVAISQGGIDQVDNRTWARLGSTIKAERGFLNGFIADLNNGENPRLFDEAGKLKADAVIARARSYKDSAYVTFQNFTRVRERQAGVAEERRILSASEHCDTCLAEAGKGWQPIGTLKRIGDSECSLRCKCYFSYRETA